jgi:hypothetical protein
VVNSLTSALSFYKEEIAEEDANYIHNRALVTGARPLEVLKKTADEAALSCSRVNAILANSPVELAAWTAFRVGYV